MTLSELAYKIGEIDHKYLSGILLAYITDFAIYQPDDVLPSRVVENYYMIMMFIEDYEKKGYEHADFYASR